MLPYKVYDSLSGRVAHRLLVNGQDLVSGEKLAKGWAVCREHLTRMLAYSNRNGGKASGATISLPLFLKALTS